MSDPFGIRNIKPMLIGAEAAPFDSPGYMYELKLDGERCVAYLDPEQGTDLRNKRNMKMLHKVPELADLHKHVNKRCILDGELIVMRDGRPSFAEIQRRSLMSNKIKIELESKTRPANYTAFDILYCNGELVTDKPLSERKELLREIVINEGADFAVSRVFDNGVALFELTKQQGLEGVVAKRWDSKYYFDKRTKDWIKCKNLIDEDFVVCGYIQKDRGVNSIVLGQYHNGLIIYKGHVTLGVSSEAFAEIAKRRVSEPYMDTPQGNEGAVWVVPELVCTVKYMDRTASGGMRQPVFKGLRPDKSPGDCIEI